MFCVINLIISSTIIFFNIATRVATTSWSCWLVSWPCLGLEDDVLALVSVLRGDVLALS